MSEREPGNTTGAPESQKEKEKTLRREIADRFPNIDAEALPDADLRFYDRAKTGVSWSEFNKKRMDAMVHSGGNTEDPRMRFFLALNREREGYGSDRFILRPFQPRPREENQPKKEQ